MTVKNAIYDILAYHALLDDREKDDENWFLLTGKFDEVEFEVYINMNKETIKYIEQLVSCRAVKER